MGVLQEENIIRGKKPKAEIHPNKDIFMVLWKFLGSICIVSINERVNKEQPGNNNNNKVGIIVIKRQISCNW